VIPEASATATAGVIGQAHAKDIPVLAAVAVEADFLSTFNTRHFRVRSIPPFVLRPGMVVARIRRSLAKLLNAHYPTFTFVPPLAQRSASRRLPTRSDAASGRDCHALGSCLVVGWAARRGIANMSGASYPSLMAMKGITIKLPEPTLRQLKEEARATGRSVATLVRERVAPLPDRDRRSVFAITADLAGHVAGSRKAATNERHKFGRT